MMKAQYKTSVPKSLAAVPSDSLCEHDQEHQIIDKSPLDAASRHRLIAEAAYHRSAQRGFQAGSALDDWLAAEAEINAKLVD